MTNQAMKAITALNKVHSLTPDLDDLIQAQEADCFASAVRNFLAEGVLPADNVLARKILLYQDQFIMVKDALVRVAPG